MSRVQRRSWMRALTNPDRPSIDAPFGIELHGRRWDAATTGQAMLLVAADDPAYAHGGPGGKVITQIADVERRDCGDVDIDTLRDWAFTPEKEEYCDECGGCSTVPVNHGRIGGVLIDRALLFRFIPPGANGKARMHVGAKNEPLLFDGGDWRLYLMGMHETGGEDAPEFTGLDGAQ